MKRHEPAIPWRLAEQRHVIVVGLLVAAALRIPPALTVDLSLDETWTWLHTSELLRDGAPLAVWGIGLDAPLFVAINFAVAKLIGLSVIGLRLPSLVFGTCSVLLGHLLFRRLTTPRAALAATAMIALSPFLVYYSLEARPYAQLLFFSLGFALAFVASSELESWRRNALVSALALLCIASHYYAVVFLGAFFLIVAVHHLRRKARAALRRDFLTGVVSLLVALPLLVTPLRRLGTITIDYWAAPNPGLTVTLGEQLWFAGLNYLLRMDLAALAEGAIVCLWAVPVAVALQRRLLLRSGPLVLFLGWLPPLLVVAAGFVAGRSLLFYPRGFIASAPFLFLLWVEALSALNWRPRTLFPYLGVTCVPALAMTGLLTVGSPRHAYLADRPAMSTVAREVDEHAKQGDLILVHHWWLTQYLKYYSKTPERVHGLRLNPDASLLGSEAGSILLEPEAVPADARVLLVLNQFGLGSSDPNGDALALLGRERSLLGQFPCSPSGSLGLGTFCSRLLLFGPRRVP